MEHKFGWIAVVAAWSLLAGCAHKPVEQRQVVGPQARVRIDNGITIALYPATSCYQRDGKQMVKPYSSARTYTVGPKVVDTKSVSLGMPTTPVTPELHNEYYVEANQPAVVSVSSREFTGETRGMKNVLAECGPIYASFVPREGHDYEVIGVLDTLGAFNQKVCVAKISEIVPGDDGAHHLKPVPVTRTPVCSSAGDVRP